MQSEGLTYAQLQQLCASGNCDATLLSTVLNHFSQIDKNGDGKVTEAEIKAFGFEADRQKAWDEQMSFKGSQFSVFYGDENAEDDTSSMLSSVIGRIVSMSILVSSTKSITLITSSVICSNVQKI